MNISKKKILFVSPHIGFRKPIEQSFPEFDIEFISDVDEAGAFFAEHAGSIVLMVVGTFVNVASGEKPLTLPLVRKAKEASPQIPVIGMTVIQEFERMLLEAGCNEVCVQQKVAEAMKRFLSSE